MEIRKPCPSCGNDSGNTYYGNNGAIGYGKLRFRVECVCGVCGPHGQSHAEAMARWNELPRRNEEAARISASDPEFYDDESMDQL